MAARTGGFYNGTLQKVNIGSRRAAVKELKCWEDTVAVTPTAAGQIATCTTATDSSFFHIAQGNSTEKRVGRMAYIHELNFNGSIRQATFGTVTTPYPVVVKLALWLDKQANGAAPAYDDIMGWDIASATGDENQDNAYPYLGNAQRFTCLKCWNLVLQPKLNTDSFAAADQIVYDGRYISFNKKFKKPLAIDFSGTTGAITEINKYNVILGVKLDSGGTTWADALFECDFRFRVRFTD